LQTKFAASAMDFPTNGDCHSLSIGTLVPLMTWFGR
jgi:hypothetical protein